MGGEALDKISPQRLVLPMGRLVGFKEEALEFC
jgi:hypothetical protein